MQPHGTVSSFSKAFCLFALLLVPFTTLAEPARRRTKIVCQTSFSQAKRQDLAVKLRAITGWADLEFDKNGALQLGTDSPIGGSETARRLLSSSLSHKATLMLEDASKRKDVAFCKLMRGQWKTIGPQDQPIYVVLIDFADFDYLIGDRPALAAFDAAWGLLHEIDHAVNDSRDSSELGRVGDCEDHINQMRIELDLPQRSDYFYTLLPLSESSAFSTKYVRLAFDQKDVALNKHRRYWLVWDATVVGDFGDSSQISKLR